MEFIKLTCFYNFQIPGTKPQTIPDDPNSKFDSAELVAGQTDAPPGSFPNVIITRGLLFGQQQGIAAPHVWVIGY